MRITREHFRFLSGAVQGLDARVLWDRYLFSLGPPDLRRIRSLTSQLHDELGALAQRAGRPGVAALLRRRSIPASASAATLTVDEFSASLPADMHSQAELLTLWAEAQDSTQNRRPAQRRQRLIARQLEALRWLESLAVAAPQPSDCVAAWLDPQIARRLAYVDIETLRDLRAWIERHGYHWHRHVPRIGVRGAERVVRWLGGHADSLGALPAHALKPASQIDVRTLAPGPAIGVVPLERLRLPASLSGAHGSNRADAHQCKGPITDDLQAVQAWLSLHAPTSHTWRAYRREAERCLLWAVSERGKALSSLDSSDCAAFRDFLTAPGAQWVSPRHVPRWSERWRPMEGGLSPTSVTTAVAIVKSLFGWLVRQHYLEVDPWRKAASGPSVPARTAPSRSLSTTDWTRVEQWLTSQPTDLRGNRLRLLITMARHTGLRESELAAARTGWLHREVGPGGCPAWLLEVPDGPRLASPRTIDLPHAIARQLLDQLTRTGNGMIATGTMVDRPLFAHRADAGRALTPGRIYTLVKGAFGRCANAMEPTDPLSAARLRRASTHWLRHTHALQLLAEGESLAAVRRRLGHRSPVTTSAYVVASGGTR